MSQLFLQINIQSSKQIFQIREGKFSSEREKQKELLQGGTIKLLP